MKNLLALIGALTLLFGGIILAINHAEANPCELAQNITSSLEQR